MSAAMRLAMERCLAEAKITHSGYKLTPFYYGEDAFGRPVFACIVQN